MNLILKTLLLLGAVWAVIGIIMWSANRATATPEKVAAYLASQPLEGLEGPERERVIRRVAAQINQLDFEQRREARENRADNNPARRFFRDLTPKEQALFTELTIGPSFDHLMKALNEMDPEERRRIAQDAVKQLQDGGEWSERDSGEWGEQSEEIFETVTSEGLRAYYEGANAETKLDLAPVLEEMQNRLQNPRRKWKRKS